MGKGECIIMQKRGKVQKKRKNLQACNIPSRMPMSYGEVISQFGKGAMGNPNQDLSSMDLDAYGFHLSTNFKNFSE